MCADLSVWISSWFCSYLACNVNIEHERPDWRIFVYMTWEHYPGVWSGASLTRRNSAMLLLLHQMSDLSSCMLMAVIRNLDQVLTCHTILVSTTVLQLSYSRSPNHSSSLSMTWTLVYMYHAVCKVSAFSPKYKNNSFPLGLSDSAFQIWIAEGVVDTFMIFAN